MCSVHCPWPHLSLQRGRQHKQAGIYTILVNCHALFSLLKVNCERKDALLCLLQSSLSGGKLASSLCNKGKIRQSTSKTTVSLRTARRQTIYNRNYCCLFRDIKMPTVGKRMWKLIWRWTVLPSTGLSIRNPSMTVSGHSQSVSAGWF